MTSLERKNVLARAAPEKRRNTASIIRKTSGETLLLWFVKRAVGLQCFAFVVQPARDRPRLPWPWTVTSRPKTDPYEHRVPGTRPLGTETWAMTMTRRPPHDHRFKGKGRVQRTVSLCLDCARNCIREKPWRKRRQNAVGSTHDLPLLTIVSGGQELPTSLYLKRLTVQFQTRVAEPEYPSSAFCKEP